MHRPIRLLAAAMAAISTPALAGDSLEAAPLSSAVCAVYGSGFQPLPGTDTCVRLGGSVRVDSGIVGGDDFAPSRSPRTSTGARGAVRMETRTQTDIGMVRTFIQVPVGVGTE